MRRSASICPAPRRKIQAAQHFSCLYLHLDQFISNFKADFRFEPELIKLSNPSAPTRALILALFAIVSAILSNFAGFPWVRPFLNTPLLPGIYFGMVLGLAIWFWVSRSAWKILTVLLSTVIAWVAAWFTAEHAFGAIEQMLKEIAAPGTFLSQDQFYGRRQRGAWGIGRKHYTDVRSLACVQRIWSV